MGTVDRKRNKKSITGMRKQYKQKLKSCKMCKPHKMHWANRWKAKDISLQKEAQKEINSPSS